MPLSITWAGTGAWIRVSQSWQTHLPRTWRSTLKVPGVGDDVLVLLQIVQVDQPHRHVLVVVAERHRALATHPRGHFLVSADQAIRPVLSATGNSKRGIHFLEVKKYFYVRFDIQKYRMGF